MGVSPELKAHPDYSKGYFAGLNDEPCSGGSDAYRAGFENGTWARELFESHGFTQSGDSEFRISLALKPNSAPMTQGEEKGR